MESLNHTKGVLDLSKIPLDKYLNGYIKGDRVHGKPYEIEMPNYLSINFFFKNNGKKNDQVFMMKKP